MNEAITNDAMAAEFDTVAEWTADVAVDLGPEFYLPAGCRGSGSPAVLQWFTDRLGLAAGTRMLDCGAGVGGPAAFAAERTGVTPVLSDPEAGACRAARRLFRMPVVQSSSDLPFSSGSFDVAWCLGVLCTVQQQDRLLAELSRVLAGGARLGLLVFVADSPQLPKQPQGNNFPTRNGLRELLTAAGLDVEVTTTVTAVDAHDDRWQERSDAVESELQRRHKSDPRWQAAQEQSTVMGDLLNSGDVVPTMLIARVV